MTDHKPMPVKGYTPQPQEAIDLSNEGKELEERVLRYIEKVQARAKAVPVPEGFTDERGRYAALGRTSIQDGFMWTIRAIFNPQRATLPEDQS